MQSLSPDGRPQLSSPCRALDDVCSAAATRLATSTASLPRHVLFNTCLGTAAETSALLASEMMRVGVCYHFPALSARVACRHSARSACRRHYILCPWCEPDHALHPAGRRDQDRLHILVVLETRGASRPRPQFQTRPCACLAANMHAWRPDGCCTDQCGQGHVCWACPGGPSHADCGLLICDQRPGELMCTCGRGGSDRQKRQPQAALQCCGCTHACYMCPCVAVIVHCLGYTARGPARSCCVGPGSGVLLTCQADTEARLHRSEEGTQWGHRAYSRGIEAAALFPWWHFCAVCSVVHRVDTCTRGQVCHTLSWVTKQASVFVMITM